MNRRNGILLTYIFISLGFVTSSFLWGVYGWIISIQVILILSIGFLGEHVVSGQGYYHYTELNGILVGKVASWIPFMWLFIIQGLFIAGLFFGLDGISSSFFTGTTGALIDLILIEPYCSRKKSLWIWKRVENGYFSFVPSKLNRFTAPAGNYVVWYLFPLLMGLIIAIPTSMF
ncbi:MAG: hypothetical protein ACFFF4_02585 [Candidatus Thorarchaeota archaeon]